MDTAAVVTKFIVEVLLADDPVDDLDPDYDLVATGIIDSLGFLRLMGWLQEEFGVTDDANMGMDDFRSVRAICEFIDNTMPLATSAGGQRRDRAQSH